MTKTLATGRTIAGRQRLYGNAIDRSRAWMSMTNEQLLYEVRQEQPETVVANIFTRDEMLISLFLKRMNEMIG